MQLAPVAPARAANTGAAVNLGELRAAGKDGELRAAVANSAPSIWGNSAPSTPAPPPWPTPRRQYHLGELRAGIRVQLAPVAPARAANTGAAVNLGELRAAGKDGELRAAVANSAPSIWGNSAPSTPAPPPWPTPRRQYHLGELRAGIRVQLAPVAPARAANTGAAVNLRELRAAVNTGAVNTGAAAVANSAPSIWGNSAPSTPAPPPWPTPRRQYHRRRQPGGTPRRIRRAGLLYRRRGQLRAVNTAAAAVANFRAANTAAAVNLGELRAGPRRIHRRRQPGGTPRRPAPDTPAPSTWGNSAPARAGYTGAVNLGELRAAVANSAPPIWGNSAPPSTRRHSPAQTRYDSAMKSVAEWYEKNVKSIINKNV